MIIHRPFLCISESAIPTKSQQPGYSPLSSARACIGSACKLTALVTSEDSKTMMRYGPWWCLVHFLSTAASVIVLELALHSKHVPGERDRLFSLGDRIVEWFEGLQGVDLSSQRCFIVLEDMMRLLRLHNNMPSGMDQSLFIRMPPLSQSNVQQSNVQYSEPIQLQPDMGLADEAAKQVLANWGEVSGWMCKEPDDGNQGKSDVYSLNICNS